MSEEKNKTYRLLQVSKELNVGAETLAEFLNKKNHVNVKGETIDGKNLNEKISSDSYGLLLKEFAGEKKAKEKNKASTKPTTSRETKKQAAKVLEPERVLSGLDASPIDFTPPLRLDDLDRLDSLDDLFLIPLDNNNSSPSSNTHKPAVTETLNDDSLSDVINDLYRSTLDVLPTSESHTTPPLNGPGNEDNNTQQGPKVVGYIDLSQFEKPKKKRVSKKANETTLPLTSGVEPLANESEIGNKETDNTLPEINPTAIVAENFSEPELSLKAQGTKSADSIEVAKTDVKEIGSIEQFDPLPVLKPQATEAQTLEPIPAPVVSKAEITETQVPKSEIAPESLAEKLSSELSSETLNTEISKPVVDSIISTINEPADTTKITDVQPEPYNVPTQQTVQEGALTPEKNSSANNSKTDNNILSEKANKEMPAHKRLIKKPKQETISNASTDKELKRKGTPPDPIPQPLKTAGEIINPLSPMPESEPSVQDENKLLADPLTDSNADADADNVIRAQDHAPKLPGLKIIGKLDLPDPNRLRVSKLEREREQREREREKFKEKLAEKRERDPNRPLPGNLEKRKPASAQGTETSESGSPGGKTSRQLGPNKELVYSTQKPVPGGTATPSAGGAESDADAAKRKRKRKRKRKPADGAPQANTQGPQTPNPANTGNRSGGNNYAGRGNHPNSQNRQGNFNPNTNNSNNSNNNQNNNQNRGGGGYRPNTPAYTGNRSGPGGGGYGGGNAPGNNNQSAHNRARTVLAQLGQGAGRKRQQNRKDKRTKHANLRHKEEAARQASSHILEVTEFLTANELAQLMDVNVNSVIAKCMALGMFVSINQRIDSDVISLIAEEFGYTVKFISLEESYVEDIDQDLDGDLVSRAPIVTVMGHVDHGKTSLLDYIRKANVIAGEAGGITQHIGAYEVTLPDGRQVTFLDTPGHEAFTAMRARGAQITDIAIIVIAADDQVMPQTREAITHAQAAGVPMVFAINKIDKPGANPEKIKEQLAQMNLLVEDWGGKYQCQHIAAKFGDGVDVLLEKVLLEAEFLNLRANPNKLAKGTVIEAQLDKGRGVVVTMLVQNGTLKVGDVVLANCHYGKVKAMMDERGRRIKEAGPSTPVQILGLDGLPQAGDKFQVFEAEREARDLAAKRQQLMREQSLRMQKHISLEEIARRAALGDFKELNLIVKGDVDGSVEALADSLIKLSTPEVAVRIVMKGVGQISESDVLLASASNAIILGFQVRPSAGARKIAQQESIDIRLYSVIYNAINEIKDALEGLLSPKIEEEITGSAEVRETFKVTRIGMVAGCMITEGKILRGSMVRLVRDGIVVYTGKISSLRRFKEDVKEVAEGFECGISIENFNDIKVNDVIEAYTQKEIKRTLFSNTHSSYN